MSSIQPERILMTGWRVLAGPPTVGLKGYFWYNGRFFEGEAALQEIAKQTQNLSSWVREIDGNFAFYVITGEEDFFVTDIYKSVPLYFTRSRFRIAEEIHKLISPESHVSETNLDYYLAKGSSFPGETLINDIFDLQPGSILSIRNSEISISRYHRLDSINPITPSFEVATVEFNRLLNIRLERLSSYFASRKHLPIIVTLSGGIDSRIVLWMLIRLSLPNPIYTVTFGLQKNEDVEAARKIAEAFGLSWKFYEFTETDWADLRTNYEAVFSDSNGWKALPHFFDYLSAKRLLKDFPAGIIVNGHLMDNLAGHTLPPSSLFTRFVTPLRFYRSYNQLSDTTMEKLRNEFGQVNSQKAEENWRWETRLTSYILGGRIFYQKAGYEVLSPTLFKEFVDFFYALPFSFRYRRNFLRKVLSQTWEQDSFLPLKDIKIPFGTKLDSVWYLPSAKLKAKVFFKFLLHYLLGYRFYMILFKTKIIKENLRGEDTGHYLFFKEKELSEIGVSDSLRGKFPIPSFAPVLAFTHYTLTLLKTGRLEIKYENH